MTPPPSATPTSADDLASWLALLRIPGIGPNRYLSLLKHFHTPQQVFEAGSDALRESGLLPAAVIERIRNPDWQGVATDLAWQEHPGNHILTLDDPDYPALLREIAGPPPVLYLRGNKALLATLQLAIVGSRNPSPMGSETAFAFARALARDGLTITSGLAAGIDAACHRGALDGGGHTIAVTGTGLDQIYPKRHLKLAEAIARQGALVSEFPLGTPPLAENFPRRNRIISGLSVGTLVTEATVRSGSLITARMAIEQGREVFAIPGSIHNPLSHGCHLLIRQGAKLVENTNDILEELGPLAYTVKSHLETTGLIEKSSAGIGPDGQAIIDNIGFDPTSIDMLIERTGLTAEELSSILLVLELQGHVKLVPGGAYIRS